MFILFERPHAQIPYSIKGLKSELYIVSLAFNGTVFLSFDNAKTAFAAFPETYLV
jgi:hypothetical protein